MRKLFSKLALGCGALLLVCSAASTAKADILLATGNNPQTDENVLLNSGLTGNPIFGRTNQTQISVRFSSTELLTAPANGQARVEAADGTLNALRIELSTSGIAPTSVTLADVDFDPAPDAGSFTSLILNLDAEADGTVIFRACDTTGDCQTFAAQALSGSGQNFFTFTTINGQRIAYVELFATVPVGLGLDDVQQVRIGGAQGPAAIPEPATMILLGTGLAGVAAKVRSRRRRKSAKS